MRHSRLVIPAVLAVSTFVAVPACDDDPNTDTSGSETSGASATGSMPNECADIEEEMACADETQFECRWNTDNEECEADCAAYPDEEACGTETLCVWDSNEGCMGPI